MLHDLDQMWPRLREIDNVESLKILLQEFGFDDTMTDRFPYQTDVSIRRKQHILQCCPLVLPLQLIIISYAHEDVYDITCKELEQKVLADYIKDVQKDCLSLFAELDSHILHFRLEFWCMPTILSHFFHYFKINGFVYFVQRIAKLYEGTTLPGWMSYTIRDGLCFLNLEMCYHRVKGELCLCGIA